MVCGCFCFAGFLLLVLLPAPAALGEFFESSLFDDFLTQALVSLLRGDVVDAGMVVLRVVPGKVPIKIGDGLAVIQEATGIFRGAFGLSLGVLGRANN